MLVVVVFFLLTAVVVIFLVVPRRAAAAAVIATVAAVAAVAAASAASAAASRAAFAVFAAALAFALALPTSATGSFGCCERRRSRSPSIMRLARNLSLAAREAATVGPSQSAEGTAFVRSFVIRATTRQQQPDK